MTNNLITVKKDLNLDISVLYQIYCDLGKSTQKLADRFDIDYSLLSHNGVLKALKKYEEKEKLQIELLEKQDDLEMIEQREKLNRLKLEQVHETLINRLHNVLREDQTALFSMSPQELIVFIEKSQKALEYYKNLKPQENDSKIAGFLGKYSGVSQKDDLLL